MTIYDFVLLVSAGFTAGTINALAGGGTIFTFSALMAVGLPPVVANATSAVSVLPGQIAAAAAYRREIAAALRHLRPYAIISAIGGVAGGLLLLKTDPSLFRWLVPFLILFATVLFIAAPRIASLGERLAERRSSSGPGAAAVGLQGLVAVYGGYFGAGMGIMMLATLSLTEGRDFHRLNAAKNILACIMQGLAVVVFVVSGTVDWPSVVIVACASIAGGWASVTVGRLIPQAIIRALVIATGLALSAWYLVA
ncbi:sulfite exporter TauE/SafE family protein [Pikeienuella sp. HZG-20]|uniref:sulfite exporter TauE/SafE family protein n=1 Tax=Paludibacillus litoralis TaxID=3133267 RepID=UPI0030EB5D64